MPEILYCDCCGRMILPSATANGKAVVTAVKSLCPECLRALRPEERDELRAASASRRATPITRPLQAVRAPQPRKSDRVSDAEGSRSPLSSKLALVAIVISGVLAGTAVGLLVYGGTSDVAPEAAPAPPAVVVAQPAVAETAGAAAAGAPDTAAARQLEGIRAMVTPDLAKYGEMRPALVRFPADFPGTPEAEDSKGLLFEIDLAYAQLADEALKIAVEAAGASASRGDFDGALSAIRSVASRFGEGPWLETTGKAKISAATEEFEKRRAERESANAGETLAKARAAFDAGRSAEAVRLVARRADWPADVRAKADELVAEIERKAAAAAAAKKLAEEREAILGEFDRLVTGREYAAAARLAEAEAAKSGNADAAEMLRAAARIAKALEDLPAAARRGARTMVGKDVRLETAKGIAAGELRKVEDDRLVLAISFRVNNQVREKPVEVEWKSLPPDKVHEFAVAGGWDLSPVETAVARAYGALAAPDTDGAKAFLAGVGNHALASHLLERIKAGRAQTACEEAMAEARRLAGLQQWKRAVAACERALEAKQGDAEATALLADVRKRMEPESLLVNGGFEQDLTGWDISTGASSVTSNAHSGAKAAQIFNSDIQGGRRQEVTLRPNTAYALSAWGKRTTGGGFAGCGFTIYRDGAEVLKRMVTYTSADWAQKSLTFTTPADFDRAEVWVWAHAGNTLVVDDVKLSGGPDSGRAEKATAEPAPRPVQVAGASLVVNGGFETVDAGTRFAARWTPHQWGAGGASASIRLDASNPHAGDRAVVVRGLGDGVEPGMWTTVTLDAGRYVVSYWACADIEARAQVVAHLAGKDLAIQTVGEDWTRFEEVVEIEERSANATLKLRTLTPRVRVWFDDVDVKAVR